MNFDEPNCLYRECQPSKNHAFIWNEAPLGSLQRTVLQLWNLFDPGCVIDHLEFHQHIRDLVILADDGFAFSAWQDFWVFLGWGGEKVTFKKKNCRPYSKTNLLILAPNSHSSLLDALEWKAMEEGHGSWRRKEKGRYPRKKRLKNLASPQPARGSSALCLQCLLPPHFPGQGTTGWFYLNCYQGKFLNYTEWWGWLKKCPVSQPWKKSQVSYCTLLPQQFRLLLGFKCLWRLFFFFLLFLMRLCEDMCTWV